jgi:hypothetical protein
MASKPAQKKRAVLPNATTEESIYARNAQQHFFRPFHQDPPKIMDKPVDFSSTLVAFSPAWTDYIPDGGGDYNSPYVTHATRAAKIVSDAKARAAEILSDAEQQQPVSLVQAYDLFAPNPTSNDEAWGSPAQLGGE